MSKNSNDSKPNAPDLVSILNANPLIIFILCLGVILAVALGIVQSNKVPVVTTEQQQKTEKVPEEDAWEARLRREEEEWRKKQQQEINSSKNSSATAVQDNSEARRNQVASMMVAVACGGSKGLMPRNQMGSMLKQMLESKGINANEVFNNWDYYWSRATEMDKFNQTYCIK